MIRYEHTQIGYLTICVLFCVAIFVAIMGIATPPDRHGLLINALIEVILFICVVVFSKLTIKNRRRNFAGLLRNGTHLQKDSAGGDCRMRTNPHPLVVWLGNSPDAVRVAL